MLLIWLIAFAPLAVVLALMFGLRWSAGRAGLAGWLVALAAANLAFGAGGAVLLTAQAKALLLAAFVLYIIWMALLFYHTLNEAGAVQAVGAGLTSLTADRGLQGLLLGWAFGSFLQGVSGYGVPTAVVAPLLVGVGFAPLTAVVIAGIGHAWAVTFGSLAASFLALLAATGRSGAELAPASAMLLGLACFACGAAVLWAIGGPRALWRGLGHLAVMGTVMSGVQYTLAVLGLYPLAAVGAGLAGIATGALLARWQRPQPAARVAPPTPASTQPPMPAYRALLPYGLLILIVGLAEFAGPVQNVLDAAVVRIQFLEVRTALGYVTPAETGRTISVFGHPGALLAYTAVFAYLLFRSMGCYRPAAAGRILRRTARGAALPSVGVAAMVAMAVTMEHAGMTRLLAEGLSATTGSLFPFVSPLVGALGAFMTGSNTNSNVVFAALQQNTAQLLALSPALILAGQTAGGAIGAAFAPAKVIVGCSTVGLGGREAAALRSTLSYGLLILVVIGLVVWVLS